MVLYSYHPHIKMNKYKNVIFICCLLFIATALMAQSSAGRIKGFIWDKETGERLTGASVYISLLHTGRVSNEKGEFIFENTPEGDYLLEVSFVGYKPIKIPVVLNQKGTKHLEIGLLPAIKNLEGVTITGKTTAGKIRNQPMPISVLETRDLFSKSLSNADALQTISGVNVRQSGALGSEANFSINGMSGKQIRFFLDGIPLEYYSNELNIGSIPSSFFSRFEVYKGAVPISLASDVLGGAINVVSQNKSKKFIDLSYGIGSFSTHKLILNARYFDPRNFYWDISAFANHSDNDYEIKAEVLDKEGNSSFADVKRFHNKYSNFMVRSELGVKESSWADQAFISFYISGNQTELQHDALANQPYGKAVSKNTSVGTLIRYKKRDFLTNFDIDAYIVGNYSRPHLIDTSLNVYNWKGEVIAKRNQGGEISASGNDLRLKDKSISGQMNIVWHLSPRMDLLGSAQKSYFHRIGSDKIVSAYYGKDYYANPQSINKMIIGLALKVHSLNEYFTSITSVKYFDFKGQGYSRDITGFVEAASKKNNFGFGQAFSYKFNPSFSIKSSYEYALRIPDIYELFGDQMLILPNLALSPETSHNINLGIKYQKRELNAELNVFYRYTDNIIWQRPSSRYFMFQNLSKSASGGIEGEVSYRLFNAVRIGVNATYQDIRNRSDVDESKRYYNERIPNIPYFFGNANIQYNPVKFLWKKMKWSVWYSMRYVNEFYLFWEGDGNKGSKNIIPNQYSGNIGGTLTEKDGKYSLTLECQNIFNDKLYDNFRIQKPGRAFYLTLSYTIR